MVENRPGVIGSTRYTPVQGGGYASYSQYRQAGSWSATYHGSASEQPSSQEQVKAPETEAQKEKALEDIKKKKASSKVGPITRITTNPVTGEKTYQGPKGKYTFPKEGLSYSGADKFGGTPSQEQSFIPSQGNLYIREKGITKPVAQSGLNKRLEKERAFRLQETGARAGFSVTIAGSQAIFSKPSNKIYQTEIMGYSRRPGSRELVPIKLPIAGTGKEISELSPMEFESYSKGVIYQEVQSLDYFHVAETSRRLPLKLAQGEGSSLDRLGESFSRTPKHYQERWIAAQNLENDMASFRKTAGIESGIRNIDVLSSGLDVGPMGKFQKGFGQFFVGLPFYAADFSTRIPGAAGKAYLNVEGMIRHSTRSFAIQAGAYGITKGTLPAIWGTISTPEGAGFLMAAGSLSALMAVKPIAKQQGGLYPKFIKDFFPKMKGSIKTESFTPQITENFNVKRVSRSGTIGTIDVMKDNKVSYSYIYRQEGPLQFSYTRAQVPEYSLARQAPILKRSAGIIKSSSGQFDYSSVSFDRGYTAYFKNRAGIQLKGTTADIFVRKTAKGDLIVKYLSSDVMSEKVVLKQFRTNYKGAIPSFSKERLFGIKLSREATLDSGVINSKSLFRMRRQIALENEHLIYGSESSLKDARMYSRTLTVQGLARSRQLDVSGYQRIIYREGGAHYAPRSMVMSDEAKLYAKELRSKGLWRESGTLDVTLNPSDIEYVVQPTYKSSFKELGISPANQPYSYQVQQPTLTTKRILRAGSISQYDFSISGIRPIKELARQFTVFKAERTGAIYSMKGRIIIDPFKLALRKESIGVVKIPSRIQPLNIKPPTLNEPALEVFNRLLPKSKGSGIPLLMHIPISQRKSIPISRSFNRQVSYSRMNIFNRINLNQFNFNRSMNYSKSYMEIIQINRIFNRTTTTTTTRTVTFQLTNTLVGFPSQTIPSITPPQETPPIPWIFPLSSKGKGKGSRKKRSANRPEAYQPSLIGELFKFSRSNSKLLTGLEIRGI